MAQSLDEYKTAVSNIGKGCESIPFSTLRSRCIDSEKETDKWCYEEKWKCDKDTDGLIASINGMKKKVDDLNDQRYKASGDDEKRKLDDQIKELTDRRASFRQKLEQERKDIQERIDRGTKCRDARRQTQNIFKDAITQASNVDSGSEKKPYADKLMSYWRDEGPRHDAEIEKVIKGVEKCEEIYKKKED